MLDALDPDSEQQSPRPSWASRSEDAWQDLAVKLRMKFHMLFGTSFESCLPLRASTRILLRIVSEKVSARSQYRHSVNDIAKGEDKGGRYDEIAPKRRHQVATREQRNPGAIRLYLTQPLQTGGDAFSDETTFGFTPNCQMKKMDALDQDSEEQSSRTSGSSWSWDAWNRWNTETSSSSRQ